VITPEIHRYAQQLGKHRDEVRCMLEAAARSQQGERIALSVLGALFRRECAGADSDDPFALAPGAYKLGGDGIHVAFTTPGDADVVWLHDEIPYSALFIGAPGFGKTTIIIRILLECAGLYTAIIPDLRGDYECLCRAVPNARLFALGEVPINFLMGPSCVPPSVFNQRFCEVFTDQFDQYQSSRRYLNLVLDGLDAKREETGHWPCLLDLRDALEDKKEQRGSDELRFRNRCLARVDALCRALGEKSVGVERGIDLDRLIQQGAMLIFRMELEKSIQDFLTNWLLMYVFELRTSSENKFNLKSIVFVLDEQRSILRIRR